MAELPKSELARFYSSLNPVSRKALDWEFSSFTDEEWSDYVRIQHDIAGLREQLEPILKKIPAKWNRYSKAQKAFFKASVKVEVALVSAKAIPGRPRKDVLAARAARLRKTGLSNAKIAAQLNQAAGLKQSDANYATSESIRKLLIRHGASRSTPDEN